ncbi:fatty acyl CoA synthetase [Neoasaia chiangmaiensis NBRC 101099]|uniref:Uncharacterized protein n=1 Tax=Neoasaia chiangmaiensis TaxID=320497 RepID=A0A1U9KLT7_9PROT|nr:LolA-related protein [Neoasaia chiangmaiensis]AQS86756.1 hypothetical protein A0U93_00950 [Neoasaia chiangmaiensis]GBR35558.1 fatty acyl CoA synthetase [Neoasaia chiangmaiensis NBRC 101099]GEN16391.1 hypothetical protein NCH01_28220 [Neoasaia chiangmaiensis]
MKPVRVILAVGILTGIGGAKAADQGAELAARIVAQLGQVPERARHFQEHREIAALDRPLVTTGTLTFRKPDFLEKTTITPRLEDMTIQGDRVSIRRGDGPVHVIMLDQSPELSVLATTLRAPLSGDSQALRHYYTLSASGDLGHWTLLLSPVDQEAARYVRNVTLAGRNNVVDSVRVVLRNGDRQMLVIDP